MVEEQDSSHKYVKPLDILDGKSGHLQLCFIFFREPCEISTQVCGEQSGCFYPKSDPFQTLFVPEPDETICKAFAKHQIKY